jgi:glycosyltransferase involved in cell wall biosynthesis
MDKVSVIIPAFNHAEFLGDAIKSVKNSIHSAYEILVIDDGSTDNTKAIACKYKEVNYYYKENGGAPSAINFGIKKSTGDYIAILNDDDTYGREHLSVALLNMRTYGNELFIGAPKIIGEGRKYSELKNSIYLANLEIENWGLISSLFRINWAMSTSSFVFSKKIANEINGFQNFSLCHDLDFLLRVIFEARASVGTCKSPTWQYRCHFSNSVSFIDPIVGFAEILYVLGRVYYQFHGEHTSSSFATMVGYGIDSVFIEKVMEAKPWVLKEKQTLSESISSWVQYFSEWSSRF